ncbi:hypothetical protein BVRB_1g021850 [Beta vulgaris subsp. vulgaris]|uniref:transcription factor bHLH93 n=1 Tax=Beta vulgaris subsp. vulgaris TaxID=3555 RepID=UPI00053FDD8A|nr:transcription factor bHLH93 [Beta vulgaris subsp. vulgaris]KMS99614.1 hypothetical protein BVRB_1g021850 [Beta vulgaris subsp. vulgaris]
MEMNEDGFLEELLALRREAWESTINPSSNDHQINGFFSTTTWAFDGLDSTLPNTSTTSYDSFSSSIDQPPPITSTLDCSSFFIHPSSSSGPFSPHEPTFPGPGPGPDLGYSMSMMDADDDDNNNNNNNNNDDNIISNNNNNMVSCKAEHSLSSGEIPSPTQLQPGFNIGLCMEKSKSKVKRVEGQPSKNLMAERRRRKRLNDRLSMLRSVVPKISKMDRTSILGDTIDYMKELLERINKLQEEVDLGSNQLNLMSIFKDMKPNDVLVRNSPKFDVERRNVDTKVEICCAGKPGLLLSTVTTLEAMGLEIQQCVISCFNDFSLQASCDEEMEQKSLINSEDIKQALFRNAGYGGRCL